MYDFDKQCLMIRGYNVKTPDFYDRVESGVFKKTDLYDRVEGMGV